MPICLTFFHFFCSSGRNNVSLVAVISEKYLFLQLFLYNSASLWWWLHDTEHMTLGKALLDNNL